jgi:hypothetical protein
MKPQWIALKVKPNVIRDLVNGHKLAKVFFNLKVKKSSNEMKSYITMCWKFGAFCRTWASLEVIIFQIGANK